MNLDCAWPGSSAEHLLCRAFHKGYFHVGQLVRPARFSSSSRHMSACGTFSMRPSTDEETFNVKVSKETLAKHGTAMTQAAGRKRGIVAFIEPVVGRRALCW